MKSSLKSRQNLLKVTYTREEVDKFKRELRAYRDAIKSGEWKNIPYNVFLSLVRDRPNPTLSISNPQCPVCDSHDVTDHGGSSTCVGGGRDYDPNHHWHNMVCNERGCHYAWTMEFKGRPSREGEEKGQYNVWYTHPTDKGTKILRGIPTCFERYIYTCQCGGDVRVNHYNNGTRNLATSLSYHLGEDGKNKKSYYTLFECDSCRREVSVDNYYYLFDSPYHPRKPFKKLRWRIQEEMGICVINDYSISKVEI